jgi:hypothetical protein
MRDRVVWWQVLGGVGAALVVLGPRLVASSVPMPCDAQPGWVCTVFWLFCSCR